MLASDRGFVANRWVNTGKRLLARQVPDSGPGTVNRRVYSLLVDDLLDTADVRVICPERDIDVTLGFVAIMPPGGLLYLYLVSELRGRGHGKAMLALAAVLLEKPVEQLRAVLHPFGKLQHDPSVLRSCLSTIRGKVEDTDG